MATVTNERLTKTAFNAIGRTQLQELLDEDLQAAFQVGGILMGIVCGGMLFGIIGVVLAIWFS